MRSSHRGIMMSLDRPNADSSDIVSRATMLNGGRLHHIDGIRGMAILAMIWAHGAVAIRPESQPPAIGLAFSAILGGLAAPLFVTISGWGLHISAKRRIASSDRGVEDIARWLAPRLSILVVSQVVVNVTMGHLFDITTPGILTMLAIAAIVAPCIAGLPVFARVLLAVGIATAPLMLGGVTGPDWNWDQRMAAVGALGTIERLLWNGAYPAIPWLSFSILGSIISDTDSSERVKALFVMIPASLVVAAMLRPEGGAWVETIGDASLTFFPASTPFIAVAATACLSLHLGMELSERTAIWGHSVGRSIVSLGRLSLTVYILHFFPLAILHRVSGTPIVSISMMAMMVILYTAIWMPFSSIHRRLIPTLSIEHLLHSMTPVSGEQGSQ